MVEQFQKELEVYELKKDELMGKARGKFVLIKGDEVAGVFETKIEAIKEGYKKFGRVAFLVKQIVEVETTQHFTSNLLNI